MLLQVLQYRRGVLTCNSCPLFKHQILMLVPTNGTFVAWHPISTCIACCCADTVHTIHSMKQELHAAEGSA